MPIVRERTDNVKLGAVLSNSFGFGGTNASLVFKHWMRDAASDGVNAPADPDHVTDRRDFGRSRMTTRLGMPGLMEGKRGLIMGVANDHSIAWGIAKMLRRTARELAFTYQGDALRKRVKPLAEQTGSDLVMPCDVEDIASVDALFDDAQGEMGHASTSSSTRSAFSDKNELKGRYADTTRENFIRTMVISCFSFTESAKRAAALMPNGGSMVTLTYNGGDRAHAELQRDGRGQGGAGSLGALSRRRFRPPEDPRQRDLGRSDPHAGRRRHRRRALHVRLPAEIFAARPRRDA